MPSTAQHHPSPAPVLALSVREEIWNALTHGLGAVASVAAGTALITLAAIHADTRAIVAAAVFTAALVLLYSASTLYHAIPHARVKARLKVVDHCAIFVLIAGTYTPFTLVSLRGPWGWTLFGLAWGLAALGVVFKLFFTGRFRFVSTLLYVALGWMVVIAWRPMSEAMSPATLWWLFAGGIAYTGGTVFYMSRRIPYAHGIWHLFVLGGSVCHYAAVARELL
ncbi:MAG TPA: hemolysin III family protein [Gemmatimonadaceae bacterium]|nr:hemolysin III family protein [Gemmatimonadaceae bacterium]